MGGRGKTAGLRSLATAGICALSGCYSYVPVDLEAVRPGEDVRVTITREAAERMEPALPGDRTTLEGEVVQAEPGSLWVSVATGRRQSGFQFERMGQTVIFDWDETLEVELRTLEKQRTATAIGAAVVAVGAITWTALSGKTGGKSGPGPGDGPADDPFLWTISLLRLPLRIP